MAVRFLVLRHSFDDACKAAQESIRVALSIDLNRDGDLLNMAPNEVEYRRRVWWSTAYSERFLCTALNRPSISAAVFCDAKAPSEIDFDLVNAHSLPQSYTKSAAVGSSIDRRWLPYPTIVTIAKFRHRAALLMGHISQL